MIRFMVVPAGIRSDGVFSPFTTATRSTAIVDGYFPVNSATVISRSTFTSSTL
jgi:hypothetical protein